MPLELAIPAALIAAAALTVALSNVLERRRVERMKLSVGRRALVRNLFGG